MKTKVLFIVTRLDVGGLETYLLRFLSFTKDRIETSVLCKSGETGKLDNKFSNLNTNLIYQKVNYFPSSSWIKIYQLFKDNKYDAIVDFTGTISAPIIFIGWLTKINKRIIFYRNSRYSFRNTFFRKIYIKMCMIINLKLSTQILSNSEDVFRVIFKNKKNKLFKVIKNGIPYKPSDIYDKNAICNKYKIPENSFIIGHIGRFVEQKNHTLIMAVASKLLDKYKDMYFIFCGKNVDENLKNNDIYNTYKSNFICIDFIEDVYELHQVLDCFIFPSKFEGHPNALLECVNSRVPIIASNVNSIKEHFPQFMSPTLLDLNNENEFVDKIIKYYNGEFGYNLDEASNWSQSEFDCDKCFEDFFSELI